MAKTQIFSGLDIGTDTIKLLVVSKKQGENQFEVISQIQQPSLGIRKGVVVNVETVSDILESILESFKVETGKRINSVYININGAHLFSTISKGAIAVSRADQKISGEDVQRVLEAAKTFSLPSNKEVFDAFPKEFIIDGERGIKEAVGLHGVRLESEVVVLGAFSPYMKNLTQAVLNSDLQVEDMIPSPLAAARSVLTPRQKELGVAVLDIGAGTSSLAVFEEGNLIHLAVLPIGSANITNDIATGLRTDIDIAEKIKKEFGSCIFKGSNKRIKIEVEEEESLVFSQKLLEKIITARMSDIFGEVQKELKKISKHNSLPAGVILVGGGVNLPKIVDFAKKELKLPCKVGRIQGFNGLDEDPIFATVCGLILGGADLGGGEWHSKVSMPGLGSGLGNKIKRFLKVFIP